MDYTTSPDNDNDHTDLKAALSEAKILCDQVNDGVRQKENTEQLEWLQANVTFTLLEEKLVFNSQTNFMGSRKLLHWGKFFKVIVRSYLRIIHMYVYNAIVITILYTLRSEVLKILLVSSSTTF